MSIDMKDVGTALTVFISMSRALQELNSLVINARSEGRTLHPDEIDAIHKKYELSLEKLDAAIAQAEQREAKGVSDYEP